MNIKGWKKVFKFTYIQNIKSKSFVISTIVISSIIVLMILGINFIPAFFMNDENSNDLSGMQNSADETQTTATPITHAYLLNESGIETELDLSSVVGHDVGITEITEITSSELADITDKIYNSTSAEVLIHIQQYDHGYEILISRPLDTEIVSSDECDILAFNIKNLLNNAKLIAIGVDESDLIEANKLIYTNVTIAGEAPASDIAFIINMIVPMMSSCLLFIFIIVYGQLVAQAIASEKTSRVMELLLTSVKPVAVILGKVFAMGLVSLTQLAAMGSVTGIAFILSAPFGFLGKVFGMADDVSVEFLMISEEIKSAFSGFGFMTIVWIIILFVLGFLFYALIAGLIGASISRLEDLNSAMQPLALIGVLGFYLSYIPSAFGANAEDGNALVLLSHYLPISSPFSLPSAIILGEIGTLKILVSIAVLIIFDLLMLFVVAKVYESMILHMGDRIKIKDIVKLVRNRS